MGTAKVQASPRIRSFSPVCMLFASQRTRHVALLRVRACALTDWFHWKSDEPICCSEGHICFFWNVLNSWKFNAWLCDWNGDYVHVFYRSWYHTGRDIIPKNNDRNKLVRNRKFQHPNFFIVCVWLLLRGLRHNRLWMWFNLFQKLKKKTKTKNKKKKKKKKKRKKKKRPTKKQQKNNNKKTKLGAFFCVKPDHFLNVIWQWTFVTKQPFCYSLTTNSKPVIFTLRCTINTYN